MSTSTEMSAPSKRASTRERDSVIDRFFARAEARPNVPAVFHKVGGAWSPVTWGAYAERVRSFAAGLIALGQPLGKPIAILGGNSVEWVVADLAAMALGTAGAGVYTTSSPEEVKYIVAHSEAHVLVVENAARWRTQVLPIQRQIPTLKKVVLIEPDATVKDDMVMTFTEVLALGRAAGSLAFEERYEGFSADDIGTLIYTSGTTGPPKAVMLSHRAIAWTAGKAQELLSFTEDDIGVSYLPLSHIAEQMFTIHGPVSSGTQIYFAESIEKLKETIAEVRPTLFFGVPRVWEKFHAGMADKVAKATGVKKLLLAWARGVGMRAGLQRLRGRPLGFVLDRQYRLANKLIFSKVKRAIGFDRLRAAVSGAAPIRREILEFFLSLDIAIHEVYGQSEDCGPTSFNTPTATKLGTVGRPVPGVEVKIAADGEIIVRGPNLFRGYLKDDTATQQALIDGWLHSGDVGELDAEGFLRITDRKKDLIITSGGKNIAPQNLEGMLKLVPLVSLAVCIGDARRFLAALIVLDREAAATFAAAHGSAARTLDELAKDTTVRAEVQRGIDAMNTQLAQVEHVRKFTILATEFTPDSGELTPTMKLRRKVVNARYQAEIEAMYRDEK